MKKQQIDAYIKTLKSTNARPDVVVCFYSVKAEEEDLEPCVFTK